MVSRLFRATPPRVPPAGDGLISDISKDSNYVESFKNWCFENGRKDGETLRRVAAHASQAKQDHVAFRQTLLGPLAPQHLTP